MTDVAARCIREQPRFRGIFKNKGKFERRVMLASPTMHSDEKIFIDKAFDDGFTGRNTARLEKEAAEYIGVKNAVALCSGTAAMNMAVKLAAERLYGSSAINDVPGKLGTIVGALHGKRVFCSDFASSTMADSILYEGGEPVFIDASDEDWSMDPEVLEIAFERYPDVKLVMMNHAYGFPGQIIKIKEICKAHGALLIEDASESLGAKVCGKQTGAFGDYGILSFGSDKIITGSEGGMLLTNDDYSAKKARSRASHSRAATPWRQYEELGDDCLMSDIVAGLILGQIQHLDEHIAKKRAIYERYLEKLDGDIMYVNPMGEGTEPNYWMSCITCESNIQFKETRSEREYTYTNQHGTASPMEIYDALEAFNVESSPVYKPMSMQPVFRNYDQITLDGSKREYPEFDQDGFWVRCDVAKDNFDRGLCLPSDIKMTEEEQNKIIDIIYACYDKADPNRLP